MYNSGIRCNIRVGIPCQSVITPTLPIPQYCLSQCHLTVVEVVFLIGDVTIEEILTLNLWWLLLQLLLKLLQLLLGEILNCNNFDTDDGNVCMLLFPFVIASEIIIQVVLLFFGFNITSKVIGCLQILQINNKYFKLFNSYSVPTVNALIQKKK